jgi:hypothetical protein
MRPFLPLDPRRLAPTAAPGDPPGEPKGHWQFFTSYRQMAVLMGLRSPLDEDAAFARLYKMLVVEDGRDGRTKKEMVLDARRAAVKSYTGSGPQVVFRLVTTQDDWGEDGCTKATLSVGSAAPWAPPNAVDLHIDSLFYETDKSTCAAKPSFELQGAGDTAIALHIALGKACGADVLSLEDQATLPLTKGFSGNDFSLKLHAMRRCIDGAGYYERRGFLRRMWYSDVNGDLQDSPATAEQVATQLVVMRRLVRANLSAARGDGVFFADMPALLLARALRKPNDAVDRAKLEEAHLLLEGDGKYTQGMNLPELGGGSSAVTNHVYTAMIAAHDFRSTLSLHFGATSRKHAPKDVADLALSRAWWAATSVMQGAVQAPNLEVRTALHLYAEMLRRISKSAPERGFSIAGAAKTAVDFFSGLANEKIGASEAVGGDLGEAMMELAERRHWTAPDSRLRTVLFFKSVVNNFLEGLQYAAGMALGLDYVEESLIPDSYMDVQPDSGEVGSVLNDELAERLGALPEFASPYGMLDYATRNREIDWNGLLLAPGDLPRFAEWASTDGRVHPSTTRPQPDPFSFAIDVSVGSGGVMQGSLDGYDVKKRNPFRDWDGAEQPVPVLASAR